MRVFKYKIHPADEVIVRLPVGAKILSVGQQSGDLYLWAMVDPGVTQTERRALRVAGTGHELTDPVTLLFLGTVHFPDSGLVFHVFERREPWQI